jgi:UDP-N-acetylmuramoylalanine--D-glutamate ligase
MLTIESLALQGKHSIFNSMASALMPKILDIKKEIVKDSMADFHSIEHRLEYVANIHEIEFINDSKATNVNSTWWALECMTKPVIWIAGGQDKCNDYLMLKDVVKKKVKAIICIGLDNKKFINAFRHDIELIVQTKSMPDAVRYAYSIGKSGDVVLLSPACSSYDLFDDYEDRGRQFKNVIREF